MSDSTTLTLPGPESLSGRILAYFKRNRLEEYTRFELAATFSVAHGAINQALALPLSAGWLAERTDSDGNRVVIAGAKLDEVELTPGAKTAGVLGAALAPKKAKRQRRPTLPRLDVDVIPVKTGTLAKPRGGREPGASPYFALLDKLSQVNTWVELPAEYAYSLKNALTRYRRQHPHRVYRLVKVSDTLVHVQRLDDKKPGAQA